MKILFLTTGLTTGGAEMMLYQLLSRINRERFKPVVVSLMDRGTLGDSIEALRIPVHTIGMKPGKPTLGDIWRFIHTVRQSSPDLIQGWMYHGNLAAQLASFFSFPKIPVFWDIQCSSLPFEKITTEWVIKLGAAVSKFPSQIIFVSLLSKVQHESLGFYSENSCVIPNGIDTSRFIPSLEAKLTIRRELGLPETSFLIGLICRYHPMKDHANFFQAAALIIKDYPDIQFILAGTGVEQNNHTLYQLIQELELVNHIHLLGERKDMPCLTAALDIACSASAYGEGCPLIVEEAMSCGVPCVVTDVGDSGWIVGDTGRVVPPKDSQALANAWKELIALDSQDREILGKAARSRISECFSLDFVVAQYETLYTNVLSKKSS